MSDADDERLEELRQEKMEELREEAGGEEAAAEQAEAQQEAADAQRKAMLRQHLTDGARQRLNTVKMSKPEFAEQAEQQVLALAQSGRVQGKITEEQMKKILSELKPDQQSFDIKRR
ncbi:MAG: DNA-binding protein [Halobacteriaceae archaeon]